MVPPIIIDKEKLDADDIRLLCRFIELLDRWDREAKITQKYQTPTNSPESPEKENNNEHRDLHRLAPSGKPKVH
jgi:hypothetical protein